MSDVKIAAGGYEFLARWERERCSKTCEAFEKLLPYRQKTIHARWSGEALKDVAISAITATEA